MKNLRYNNICLRALTILCLLMASVGAWAQTNVANCYVFNNGTYGYLYNNGGTLASNGSFHASSVWIASGTLGTTNRTLQSYTNKAQYLVGNTTNGGNVTIGNSTNVWQIRDGYLATRSTTNSFYVQTADGRTFTNRRNNYNQRFTPTAITVTEYPAINSTSGGFSSVGLSAANISYGGSAVTATLTSPALNKDERVAYTQFSGITGGPYYWWNNADQTATPTRNQGAVALTRYEWSLSGAGASYLSLANATTTGLTNTITYTTPNPNADAATTVTVKAVYADGTEITKTATITARRYTADPTAIAADNITMLKDENKTINPTLSCDIPGYANIYKNITYTSKNTGIATVNATSGVVTGVARGTATITISAALQGSGSITKDITVTVQEHAVAPTISFDNTNNRVTMSSTTPGAVIHYTTDGSTPTASSPTYNASSKPTVSSATTIKAIAVASGYLDSDVTTSNIQKVATPTIANSGTQVQLSCGTAGVTHYYTTNGTEPTLSSTSTTSNTISGLATGTTVKVMAAKDGMINSAVATEVFKLSAVMPTITFDNTTGELTMSSTTPGAEIHYTTNGGTPTESSPVYDPAHKPIITTGATVKAITVAPNYNNSGAKTLVVEQVATPTVTVDGTTVKLACSTDGVTYYYTTDGSDPTLSSTNTTSTTLTTIPSGSTLKVMAVKNGMVNSEVASKYVELSLATPIITISDGKVTMTSPDGATIHYTTDGSEPTASSPTYSAPLTATNGVTYKAIAIKDGFADSEVAEEKYMIASGVSGGTVTINDYEDHNWTYYQSSENLPASYPAYLSSPDPRNVIITYRGGSVNNASAVAISGLTGEGQNEMVYYKTLEKTVLGMTGNYPYQVISNPFSKRPRRTGSTGTNGYYGFAGWKIISGGKYIAEHADNDVLGLDEIIHFTNLDENYTPNCKSGEVIFEATWTAATVKTGTTAQTFTGGTYETNFWVITGNTGNISLGAPCTMSARYPDGTSAGNNSIGTGGGTTITTTVDNVKIEFLNLNTTGNISADGRNFTMGRGITWSRTAGRVSCGNRARAHTVKIESGQYSSLYHFTAAVSGAATNQLVILGNDYDRAKNDNAKLEITGQMIDANGNAVTGAAGQCYVRSVVKSGSFMTGVNVGTATYQQSYYFGGYGSTSRHIGRRFLTIEGGEFTGSVCGGTDDPDHGATARAFDLRVRGNAVINGAVYGGAENAQCYGVRTMIFTGGTVKGWVCAAANGTSNTNGDLTGTTYLYMGGNARVDSNGSHTVINRSVGGNVFAAGCGYQANNATSGLVRNGTNLVVADNTYIERGAYGGGSYGYSLNTQTTNIFITGGHVAGKNGGVNGTAWDASVPGGVYGGACQNAGGTINITMTGGLVEGGIYGGSNVTGTINQNVVMNIVGGQIGTSTTPANINGGGLGTPTRVTGNVDLTIGGTTAKQPLIYGSVYGGSESGYVNGTAYSNTKHTYVTMNNGDIHGSLYGGGNGAAGDANVYGNVLVTVNGGSISEAVYGCNNSRGAPQGPVDVVINGTDPAPEDGQYALKNVFGGGNAANYTYTVNNKVYPTVTVNNCDNSIEYVYGGGNAATVPGTDVTIHGGNVIGNVFGGGYGANITTKGTKVTIDGGTILNVYGGSNSSGTITGGIVININEANETSCPINIDNVFGGGNRAASAAGNITIGCATKIRNVYGGANQANVTSGNVNLLIEGGNIDNVFGGNNLEGNISGTITVTINENKTKYPCGMLVGNVYGGGNKAAYGTGTNYPVVNIQNGHLTGSVFGGGLGETAVVTGNPQVTIGQPSAGTVHIDGNVFGGGDAANVVGKPVVLVQNCNTVIGTKDGEGNWNAVGGTVYGGGNAAHVTGAANGTSVTINGGDINRVFGGGNGEESAANVEGNAETTIHAGNIHQAFAGSNMQGSIGGSASITIDHDGTCDELVDEVYGGGNEAAGSAGAVNIECGAIVGDVYGGANQADVDSDITLNITGGTIDRVFGGNNTSGNITGQITVNVEKDADCDLSLGDVFGAGNLAQYTGSPIVNIKNGTVTRNVYGGGKGDPDDHTKGQVTGNPLVTIGDTSKPGSVATVDGDVYGGGDAGNVVGTPQVRVPAKENTTITNVYGGGNAADVNGTDLLIDGGHITGMVFGGGHGSKDDPATPETEPTVAANVKGDVQLYVTGGTINKVFAGSNANGNITGDVDFQIAKGNTSNEMHINEVYGGGNEAAGNAGTILIGCTGSDSEGIGDVYGGANAADINSDITLTITGGRINNVFGGNNTSGDIKGDIEVNIEWNGACTNSRIGNVYGGGNLAQYSGGPVVNIKNGTISENVYGGGKGDPADHTKGQITGNPIVNIGNTADAPEPDTWVAHIVGDVYGGGDAGNVVGTPQVNIINKCNTIIDHDVYGGGNAADVSSTDVNIDGGTITGMVFGGGHGDLTTKPQKEANVGGDVHVDITGGTIGKVFGGSNSKGNIEGQIYLNINKEDGHCDMHITEVYGGGNLAAGASGNITIGCTGDYENNGEGIGDVYGGANAANINNAIDLTIKGGHINRVFGGNNASGSITGPITVNVDWDDALTCGKYLGDVFGGGNLANYANATTVNMKKGIVNHIYGGGNEAGVGSATVNMLGGDVLQGLYGGCNTSGTVTGDIAVNVTNGTIGTDADHEANVHGGGYGSATQTAGNVTVIIAQAAEKTVTIWGDVYGGSALGNVNDASSDLTKVQLDKGTVNGNIYGGGLGSKNGVNGATEDVAAVVNGEVQVVVNGGTVTEKIFGCNNLNGTPKADVTVTINGSDAPATPGTFALSEVYGGGNMADYSPDGGAVCKVVVNNCDTSVGTVYGGGNAADVTSTDVEINGGQIGTVFGGGHGDKDATPNPTEANVSGDVIVKIYGGTIDKVFAGSNSKGTIDGTATLTVNKQGTCEMHITEVYGGGNEAEGNAGIVNIACTGDEANDEGIQDVYGGARMANVTSAITLNITGGNINRVFGGNNISGNITGAIVVNIEEDGTNCGMNLNTVYGAGNQANYTGNPVVNIKKGTVKQDVFGGGLQATVTGNTTVNVTGGQVVRDLYGGGALANVEGSTAVNLTGGTVCNAYGGGLGSINGQDGATETVAALVTGNTLVTLDGSIVTGQIFGCNNVNGTPQGHAKVWVKQTVAQPDAADGAYHVLAVYGGGNKAGYYPTSDAEYAEVEVRNCETSIETVYGGGNAAPAPATQVYIWGGTIGEVFAGGNGKGAGNPGADVGYKEDHTTTYGTGTTDAYIYSGVIGGVFGGSNTKGNIREASNVHLDDRSADTGCEFRVGEIYGAGNEAYMEGDSKIDLGCVPRLEVLYGGAKNADMGGNIELNITSGAFGQVFGGNNKGGKIKGSITVNIDETGCYPVEIDELYACGNEAAYSVYGYDSDDNMLTSGAKAYTDPTVNVISCTRIGTVFGGGLGEAAVVYGDPIVNINQIKGKFAGQTHPLRTDESIADALGAIGTVFGGGNAAKVVGNTNVNVGTLAQNKHLGADDANKVDAGAYITGNIYGGGNQADVTGKTNVTIGQEPQP